MVNYVTKWIFVNAPSSAFYDYQLNQGVTCRSQGGWGGGYHIVHPHHPAIARSQHVWWGWRRFLTSLNFSAWSNFLLALCSSAPFQSTFWLKCQRSTWRFPSIWTLRAPRYNIQPKMIYLKIDFFVTEVLLIRVATFLFSGSVSKIWNPNWMQRILKELIWGSSVNSYDILAAHCKRSWKCSHSLNPLFPSSKF